MNYTVLIVDDEEMPRKVLKEHLPWDDLKVTHIFQASDGIEAVAQARLCQPDIVISDVKMPRMNGLQMAAEIRKFCPHCQFIFLSGYSDKEYLKGAIRLKAASYVEKPIDLDEITQCLSEVIVELEKLKSTQEPDIRRRLFFHGSQNWELPLNDKIFQSSQYPLDTLSENIRHRKESDTENILHRFYWEIQQCEGTDPSFLRHFYRQIVYLFLTASENYNITALTQNADHYLYTAAEQETLAQLWDTLLQISQTYFAAFLCQDVDIVSRVDRYLEQHYQDSGLTVQDVAHNLGFANTYLCAAYKKSCGKTINQRLTQLRILHAKELLAGSPQKLYEVARNVGYADGKYFTKLFTRETGLSPKEYRERHRYET